MAKLSQEQAYDLVNNLIDVCKARGDQFGADRMAYTTGYISGLLIEAITGKLTGADIQKHIESLNRSINEKAGL